MDQQKRYKPPSLYKNADIKDLTDIFNRSSIKLDNLNELSVKISGLKLSSKTKGISKKINDTKKQLKTMGLKNKKSIKILDSAKKSLADENKRILAMLDSLEE